MKTTRIYLSGCTWCKALGFTPNPNMGLVTNVTIICPVCLGNKTIPITETIEDNEIMPHDNAFIPTLENPKP